jgi:hypothetical protein
MEKTKEDIILDLVRDGKIDNEQAKILLTVTKEYVYIPLANPVYPSYTSPFYYGNYHVTC